ncbi:Zinc finger C-x8-C-x5-C-x3-H type (and similar), putative [Leishmania lindenbergi]|uniref:Zinc finger C-x8-C-x5-C-x3-H type (And similar) n=1 Tax=Leishmania lindenbergi TaxID=651832 RepID=A0AAW2ZVR9_9TRYP
MKVPSLSDELLQEQSHGEQNSEDSQADSLAPTIWNTPKPLTRQQSSKCRPNEPSPGCTTITSIDYPEVDLSPSWQPVSNQMSLRTAPIPLCGLKPNKNALQSGNASVNNFSTDTPTTVKAPVASTGPSSSAVLHYKTKRCRHFDQSGWCPYQHRCIFAHGDREFAFYTAQKGTAIDSSGEDVCPTTSPLANDHIERNVQELVEEYELAVSEVRTKVVASSNSGGGPSDAHGPRGSQMKSDSKGPPLPIVSNSPPAPPILSHSSAASQCPPSNLHFLTATPLPHSSMAMVNGASNSMAQFQALQPQNSQQYRAHQQQVAILSQQLVLVSGVNGAPTDLPFAVLSSSAPLATAPQPAHGLPPRYQQHGVFTMATGALGAFPMNQNQQLPQHQIYCVSTPYYNAMTANGGKGELPAYPGGHTFDPARSFNGYLPARFM